MSTFDQYTGITHGGYVKDFRTLSPPLPDGTQLMVVTYMVLENGAWRYKSGFSKITTLSKATSNADIKKREVAQKKKEFSSVAFDKNMTQEDW